MEDDKVGVPFYVHEGVVARQERTIKRLWILCLVIFLAFVGSNAAWIWYESQFEEQEIVQAVLQDSDDGGTNTQVIQPRLYDGVMRKIRGWG